MTLPSSGALSASQIDTEIGRASNAAISLDESVVRGLAGVASGAISFSNFYGKTYVTATYTPAAGSYSATDNGTYNGLSGAFYAVSASASVPWTWTVSGNTAALTVVNQSNTVIASGASATTVKFSLKAAATSTTRTSTITLQSGGKTWTLTLTAHGDGGGGSVMTL